jgi:MoaA/NifB/PqqE/SkfB family radical SAM enzyme
LDKPIFIVLVTNNRCNLKCVYCYGDYGLRNNYKEYSTKDLLKIIDELKDLGARLLTMHGGESLLRRDIGEIFNYAKHKGFYISFNTNGYLVPKMIDEIRCVDTVCISLDACEEINDKNRGAGSYKRIMNAIDVLLENSTPIVIHSTLTRDNMGDMEFLAKLASEKRCRLQFSILYNADELEDKNLVMNDTEMRETVRKILELKKAGYPIYYSENVLSTAIDWPVDFNRSYVSKKDADFKKNLNLIPCYHGKLKYQIDADGRVVTCWGHDVPDAPNIKTLGIEGAIKKCHDNNDCEYCAFLANNEHNALMHLSPKNIFNMFLIHVADSLKINSHKRM